jgi:uncharacterized protein (UPF0261 family)
VSVYLIATCDTKGTEAEFLAQQLVSQGVPVRIVDTGCLGECSIPVHISREEVFEAAGTSLLELVQQNNRGVAVEAAARGVCALMLKAHACGDLDGVLAIGGGAGTLIGTSPMRALPLGVPKLMVSTMAAGQVRPYVGDKDVAMLNSVVDISGLNRISRPILRNAAGAMAGMVRARQEAPKAQTDRPLIAASMFGVTTPCVEQAREIFESAGFEVLVFHATGIGGQTMEALIREGLLAGVLDITTTELADEHVGGTLSAGPERLRGAAATGLPQVVSVGATDMVNFAARNTVPAVFKDRQLYTHNEQVTLMRTTAQECAAIGRIIGERLADSKGPTTILLPSHGVSALDAEGQPFNDPSARQELFAAIQEHCGSIPCETISAHINDPEFAAAAAKKLLSLIPKT